MHPLLNYINTHFPISLEARQAVLEAMTPVQYKKGDYLLEEGKICRHLYFILKGAVRSYYNIEGRDITQWFAFEDHFVTSTRSFISNEPAVEYIQATESLEMLAIDKAELDDLLIKYPELERLVRMIYEEYYMKLEERYAQSHFKSAPERYELLLQQSPHILQRMSLGYIATYLGISQETLSRIRARQG